MRGLRERFVAAGLAALALASTAWAQPQYRVIVFDPMSTVVFDQTMSSGADVTVPLDGNTAQNGGWHL
ncbi:MAG: hypothetical protein ACK4NQ_11825 [Fimbriimonadaceae bacterium]